MTDPRVQLVSSDATDVDATVILNALDRRRIIISAGPGRTSSSADQAALYNAVNLLGRTFAHVEVAVSEDVPWLPSLAPGGTLIQRLHETINAVRPEPACAPDSTLHFAWGAEPAGPGVAADANWWNYSFGARHTPLPASRNQSGLAGVVATSFACSQILGHALRDVGAPWHLVDAVVSNLLDYRNTVASEDLAVEELGATLMAGTGSVGSSALYAALLSRVRGGPITLVDPDPFTERNRLRYPLLTGTVAGMKVDELATMLAGSGLVVHPFPCDIQSYLERLPEPPAVPVLLSSTDTAEGRLDATDVLARRTVSAGVDGMLLHIGSYGFGDEHGCASCQYVDTEPALSGAGLLAQILAVPVELVVAIRIRDGRLNADDALRINQAGRVDGTVVAGERLEDVHRRAYAQATVGTQSGGTARVAAPHVSALAGALLLVEALKLSSEDFGSYRLQGRLDVDSTGEPPGFVLPTVRDPTRRCICWSSHRRRSYDSLHGSHTPTIPA